MATHFKPTKKLYDSYTQQSFSMNKSTGLTFIDFVRNVEKPLADYVKKKFKINRLEAIYFADCNTPVFLITRQIKEIISSIEQYLAYLDPELSRNFADKKSGNITITYVPPKIEEHFLKLCSLAEKSKKNSSIAKKHSFFQRFSNPNLYEITVNIIQHLMFFIACRHEVKFKEFFFRYSNEQANSLLQESIKKITEKFDEFRPSERELTDCANRSVLFSLSK